MSIFDASSICRRNCTHYCALKKRATNHLNGFCVCTAYNLVQFLCIFTICHAHFTSSRSHNEKFKVHPSRASDILVDRMQWSRSLFVVNRIWIFWSGSVCCIITYMHIENCNKFSGILGVSLQTTMQIMSVVTEQHVHSFTHTHTETHRNSNKWKLHFRFGNISQDKRQTVLAVSKTDDETCTKLCCLNVMHLWVWNQSLSVSGAWDFDKWLTQMTTTTTPNKPNERKCIGCWKTSNGSS